MKSLKSLLTLGMLFAVSTATAETGTTLNTAKDNMLTQTKQAVSTVQNSAKSLSTEKSSMLKQASEKGQAMKETLKEGVKNTTKPAATARETLNTAKIGNNEANTVKKAVNSKKININKASVEELQALDGIGEVKAKAIVEYRKKHGAFKKSADLANVSGIGDATIENIKSSISFK